MKDMLKTVYNLVFKTRQTLIKSVEKDYVKLIEKVHIDNDNFINDFTNLIDKYKKDTSDKKPSSTVFWNFIIQMAIYFTIFYIPNKLIRVKPYKILVFIWTYIIENIGKSVSMITANIFKVLQNIYYFGQKLVIVVYDVIQSIVNTSILVMLYENLLIDIKKLSKVVDTDKDKTNELKELKKNIKKDIRRINKGLSKKDMPKYYEKYDIHVANIRNIRGF
jgi:hypothetical protein